MLKEGIYEQIISNVLSNEISKLNSESYFVKDSYLDKAESSGYLSKYLVDVVSSALSSFTGDDSLEKQVAFANKIIRNINNELNTDQFDEDIINTHGKILNAIFLKKDRVHANIDDYLKQITPYTRLSQSELFIGGNNKGISLESELKKEILSANEICFLVSFIKYTGIRIFQKELEEFTNSGGKLKIITTSYMGATDVKAVEFLSNLKNTEVKVSYNTQSERLHAKAYLFIRYSGFHTGYIGSSNLSKAAVTNGLEWNLKITTKEISHIIERFKNNFEIYWNDETFELYDKNKDYEKLKTSIADQRFKRSDTLFYFDITPHHYQKEILENLAAERKIHNRYRNLLVAATGTGKTVIAAFDFKKYLESNKNAKLLFIAHRKEILEQALSTFRGILKDNNFGDLWVDGLIPTKYNCLFASIQTLNNQLESLQLSETYYDYLVIDEVHHIAAKSYRKVSNFFKPQILLGLTATPERMDNEDILKDFCNVIAAEIRLPEALNRELLCPFQYFGITDSIDLSDVSWEKGKYVASELSEIYTTNKLRVGEIIRNLDKYLTDLNDVRALGFCVTQDHAKFMSDSFNLVGIKSDYLTSNTSDYRDEFRKKLVNKDINYLFVVDIFNEGVDIPDIDTVLFLRPTESLTVFLQQLGRGLRKVPGKDCLTVLDFVGNARPEYDFEKKFRGLVGKTNTTIRKEIEDDFPHVPLNCSIVLEKKAREFILSNIISATNYSRKQIIDKIRNFKFNSSNPLNIKNFIEEYNIPLQYIFKGGCWKKLCYEAGLLNEYIPNNETEIARAINNKWFACNSISYFQFILKLAKINFEININHLTEIEKIMCLMLHYDIWQNEGGFTDLNESIKEIGKNKILVDEIIEILSILIDRVNFIELDIQLNYAMPLKVHSRYTRDQICAAFGRHTFINKFQAREGVINLEEKNTELLFITLEKSENEYSPTTLYNDYAVSDTLFHWQSQNSSRPDKGAGLGYISHVNNRKKILLFVREMNKDLFGNTMGFVFLGDAKYLNHTSQKPMNITWELNEPIPPYIWKDSAKMSSN